MLKKENGFGAIEGILIIFIAAVIGGAGFYVYNSQKKTNQSLDKASASNNQSASTINNKSDAKKVSKQSVGPINSGWKQYESTAQKISFEYPEGWSVSEDSESHRVYISSHKGEYNKGNIPPGYQNLWISTWDQEATNERENSVKNGSPKGREAGSVSPASIKAGEITINTYEYPTVGGPALDAYWDIKGQKYYASNSTEIRNQEAMVSTLKKLLPTVRAIQ